MGLPNEAYRISGSSCLAVEELLFLWNIFIPFVSSPPDIYRDEPARGSQEGLGLPAVGRGVCFILFLDHIAISYSYSPFTSPPTLTLFELYKVPA
jgi:hypothetical protein